MYVLHVNSREMTFEHQYNACPLSDLTTFLIACEQALHLGDIVKSTRARGTREETRLRGAGKRKGELATISHKISFPPRKPRDIVKRENCHHRHAAN